jgi:sialate O-acetylesterase
MKRLILFLLFLLIGSTSFAQLKLARLFSDHVVLQRQKPIPVWGWASPNEKISVSLANQTQNTQADIAGKWVVKFSPMEAGGPYKMSITANSGKLEVNDILIGEVWLLSGQSNMEFKVSQANNFKEEKKNANFPQIRHFFVEHEVSIHPQTDLKSGSWKISSTETVGDFSAIGFFFARELNQKLNIPIGLLHSSWGGSQIEGWISKEAMLTNEELKSYAQNIPSNWQDADNFHDANVRKKIFGNDFKPTLDDEKKYTQANYDFSKWVNGGSPLGQWDWKGIWAFRGNGFMARNVEISEEMSKQETILGLCIQDSFNEIYINGKLVSAGIIKGVRKITIPSCRWEVGTNQIVVKFGSMKEPSWYGLGLMGGNDDLFVSAGNEKVSLAYDWKLMPSFAEKHEYVHSSNNIGTTIYNAMIAPLLPFSMRGVLWYQGETNAGRAYQYRQSFPLMINDWRMQWQDEFSFYFVQLSSYGENQDSNKGSNWAELREAQTMTLRLPKIGMAVTTDVGNPNDIHPTNKQDVAKRLAVTALKNDYGQDIVASSPMMETFKFDGAKATITFKNAERGFVIHDKFGYLKGFEVAGEDKIFYYTKAEIAENKVIVSHPKNQKIISVRYAWADAPEDANLFNAEGFPASPFRTDDWKSITFGQKFE